jgi:hypothetical protein
MRRYRIIVLASTALLLAAASLPPGAAAAQEVTIGTWEQEEPPRERIAIRKAGTEYFAMVDAGAGAAPRKVALAEEMQGGLKRFLRKGSKEYYQIETTGNLGLYGEKGLIRSARRTDKPRDYCYKAGWDYGRAAKILAIAGKDIRKNIKASIPEECEGLPETRKGIAAGAATVQP